MGVRAVPVATFAGRKRAHGACLNDGGGRGHDRADPLMTRDFQAGCPQECVDGVGLPPHACPMRISEDCLYLSTWPALLAIDVHPRRARKASRRGGLPWRTGPEPSDVYTPRGVTADSNLPVLVWFPGGNFDKVGRVV